MFVKTQVRLLVVRTHIITAEIAAPATRKQKIERTRKSEASANNGHVGKWFLSLRVMGKDGRRTQTLKTVSNTCCRNIEPYTQQA